MLHLASLVLVLAVQASSATEVRGTAKALDGDSLVIGDTEIRLHGIDAPEYRQTCQLADRDWACGRSAHSALKQMLGSNPVRCTGTVRDKYKRLVATCYVDGSNVNAKLVASGLALAYTRYSERYLPQQAKAQRDGVGLWRSEFERPWIWRRRQH